MLWGSGYLTLSPAAVGSLVRTSLHFQPFPYLQNMGALELLQVNVDSCYGLNARMIGIF